MQRQLQQTRVLRQNLLFAATLVLISLSGLMYAQSSTDIVIGEPYSVDSLFISPAMPQEGDVIMLNAFVTASSSPCGLKNYQIVSSSANEIYVAASYWQGSLTALCQSRDTMRIGNLQAGHYVLNFMNLKWLEFTVHPQLECKADFRYVYPKCGAFDKCPNTVEFIDQSVGLIHSWNWDFGDGTRSPEQNPMHYYADTGIFRVTLTVNGGLNYECLDMITKTVPVPEYLCKAFFNYELLPSPMMGISTTYMIRFNDQSTGNANNWLWDFGDGQTSTEQNPVHFFNEGVYIVTLEITTKYGCVSRYQQQLVLLGPIECNYTGTVRDYTGLDGCHFIIELDSGPKLEPVRIPDSFVFYDGQRVAVGYQPLLDVASICMVGILAEITCIREIPEPPCKAYFTYSLDSTANCICLNFYNQSYPEAVKLHWDFGDGTTSDERDPHHVFPYNSDSGYYVCMTMTTANGCTDTYCETVYTGTPHPVVPWEPIIGGDDNHSIVVSQQLGASAGLEYGDYIGLFFENYWGSLLCGGMIRWEGNVGVLTAWENTNRNDTIWMFDQNTDYPIRLYKNGFNEGEKFLFKIWKWRNNQIIDIENPTFTVNNVFPDSGYYTDDGMSLLTGFSSYQAQEIELHNGWNMVSLYVDPVDPQMHNIFGDLQVIVKNYKGEIVYFPLIGMTNGIWNIYEGYKVKSPENTSIHIPGTALDPQLNIPLPDRKGPFFLPYYYPRVYPIQSMTRNIENNIRYVQTYDYIDGRIRALNYIPFYGIDQIHYMKPGFAYKFSFITPMRSFTYPPADQDTNWLCCYETKSAWYKITESFEMENNRILVIPEEVLSIPAGAKVSIFADENILVGSEVAKGGNLAVTMWNLPDNEYTLVQMTVEEENLIDAYTVDFSRQATYDEGLIVLIEEMMSGIDPVTASLDHRLYPTIADNEVHLELYLENSSDVTLILYNMLGDRVKQMDFNNVTTGMNHFTFSVGNLANGQYLYSIETTNELTRGKLQVQH